MKVLTLNATTGRIEEVDVNLGGGWTGEIYKPDDESRINTTTLADDTHLKFTMLANSKYVIKMYVVPYAPGGVNFKWGLAGPAANLIDINRRSRPANSSTITNLFDVVYPTGLTNQTLAGNNTIQSMALWIDEAIIHVGGTGGVFSFQWAQGASSATAAQVKAGSYLKYKLVS